MTEISTSRFTSFVQADAAKAFGKPTRDSQAFRHFGKKKEEPEPPPRFNIEPMAQFESNRVVPAFSDSAHSAFGKKQENMGSRLMDPAFQKSGNQTTFSEDALMAFGKKHDDTSSRVTESAFQKSGNQTAFTDDAIMAFGKKADKKKVDPYDASTSGYASIHSPVLRNTLSELLPSSLMNPSEWSTSALRSNTKKPHLVVETEDFPVLGSKKAEEEKEMFPTLGSGSSKGTKKGPVTSSPKVSFADLIKKRAEEDAKEQEEQQRIMLKKNEILMKKQQEIALRKEQQDMYFMKAPMENKIINDDDFIKEEDTDSMKDEHLTNEEEEEDDEEVEKDQEEPAYDDEYGRY